jgi:signal transduction histidine kinase
VKKNRHLGLRTTLAVFVAFGAMLMVLSVVAMLFVRTATDRDRDRRERFAHGAQRIAYLAGTADEEAFSYVLSGDVEERRRFLAKTDAALAQADDLKSEPGITSLESAGARRVVAALERLRVEAIALFDDFERDRTFSRVRYDAFEQAIDLSSDTMAEFEVVVLDEYEASVVSMERTSKIFTSAIGLFALAVFVALGTVLGRRMTKPLLMLRDAVRPYRERESLPAPTRRTSDEVAQIAEVFEDMVAGRARVDAELRQAQKLEAVGRVAAGVAHDFNNVLATVLACSELALDDVGPKHAIAADLRDVIDAATRGTAICRQLVTFGQPQPSAPRIVPVNDAVAAVAPMLTRLAGRAAPIRLALHPSAPHVRVDPTQLDQVLMNLVINARDAMPDGGALVIATAVEAGRVVLSVADTGTGMDSATKRRIFEPFFTTKGVGKGTGLGLATVMRIVRDCAASIDVESAPGRGTTIRISFPRAESEVERPAA